MSRIDKIERCIFGVFIILIAVLWAYFISIWAAMLFVFVTMVVEGFVKAACKYFRERE